VVGSLKKEIERQLKVIKRHAVDVLPEEELIIKLERSLKENRPLKVKLGVDPTAPDLHLGHAVVLRKLRDFQDLGHTAILLIGDYTGLIGDPSGRKTTRPVLSEEEIKKNAETYVEQAFKILDPEKTVIDYNSRWLKPLTFADVIRLCGKFTVARLLERDDFELRMKSEQPIFLHELLYPVMQAYDSVMLEADVELGGTDQKFNLLAGRDLQLAMGQEPQIIVTMPLLEGLDGVRKMSKSYGNYIAFNDSPEEMFGKVMSISDELIARYYALVLFYDEERVEEIKEGISSGRLHPAEIKRNLAEEIVTLYHGPEAARKAREEFDRVFKEKQLPSEIPEFEVKNNLYNENGKVWLVKLIKEAGLVPSNSEARRLIEQGGVKLNGQAITDPSFEFSPRNGDILKVGKRKFLKLHVNRG
jgi:tyrosyl-tRNA synthetase